MKTMFVVILLVGLSGCSITNENLTSFTFCIVFGVFFWNFLNLRERVYEIHKILKEQKK